jgi:Flp pilus assembly protein protease CpaA
LLVNVEDESMALYRWGVVIGASLVAAGFDLRQGRIPNALTFPLLIVGLVLAAWLGGLAGLGESVGACALLALPYVLLFFFVGGGAGDAKLMGALGAWLGLRHGLIALVCVIMAGAVLAIVKAIVQRRLKLVLTSIFVSFYAFVLFLFAPGTVRRASDGTDASGRSGNLDLPYGVAIFAGVCAAAGISGIWGVEWLW